MELSIAGSPASAMCTATVMRVGKERIVTHLPDQQRGNAGFIRGSHRLGRSPRLKTICPRLFHARECGAEKEKGRLSSISVPSRRNSLHILIDTAGEPGRGKLRLQLCPPPGARTISYSSVLGEKTPWQLSLTGNADHLANYQFSIWGGVQKGKRASDTDSQNVNAITMLRGGGASLNASHTSPAERGA